MDWTSVPDDDGKYGRYLASREWALLKRRVRKRSGGACERCKRAKASQVHHVTYERIYAERLEDILDVCRPCHAYLSGKSDVDPAAFIGQATADGELERLKESVIEAFLALDWLCYKLDCSSVIPPDEVDRQIARHEAAVATAPDFIQDRHAQIRGSLLREPGNLDRIQSLEDEIAFEWPRRLGDQVEELEKLREVIEIQADEIKRLKAQVESRLEPEYVRTERLRLQALAAIGFFGEGGGRSSAGP